MTDSPLDKSPGSDIDAGAGKSPAHSLEKSAGNGPEEKPEAASAAAASAPGAGPGAVPDTDVRASDADRDRVADILREALAEGRLDADEHAERVAAVYSAKRMGELEPLVRDLPQTRPAPDGEPLTDDMPHHGYGASDNAVAIFSGATRKGRWRVGRKTNAFACFGGVEIDLTEAIFDQQHIVINATAIFGGIDIRVPENVTLRGKGSGIFGGFDVRAYDSPDPGAPVVLVQGVALFGGVEAKPKKGKNLRNLRKGG